MENSWQRQHFNRNDLVGLLFIPSGCHTKPQIKKWGDCCPVKMVLIYHFSWGWGNGTLKINSSSWVKSTWIAGKLYKLDLIYHYNSFLVNITFDFSVTTAHSPTSYPSVNLVISALPEGLHMDVVVAEQGKNSPFLKLFYNQMTTLWFSQEVPGQLRLPD